MNLRLAFIDMFNDRNLHSRYILECTLGKDPTNARFQDAEGLLAIALRWHAIVVCMMLTRYHTSVLGKEARAGVRSGGKMVLSGI
jgi:hypothetical protein